MNQIKLRARSHPLPPRSHRPHSDHPHSRNFYTSPKKDRVFAFADFYELAHKHICPNKFILTIFKIDYELSIRFCLSIYTYILRVKAV